MSYHDCVGGWSFWIRKKSQQDASCWFFLLVYITMHGSENVHRVGSIYLRISRCTVQKTCIVWFLLTYVYHDARFRKRASFWIFLYMYITMHGSENVHHVGATCICISRCTVQKTCIMLDLLIYVHHDARFRKRKVSFWTYKRDCAGSNITGLRICLVSQCSR